MPGNPFRIRKKAKNEFFRYIEKDKELGFDLDFDILYFCFMASMAAGGIKSGKDDVKISEETQELVEYFPGKYSDRRGKLLIALFLRKELELLGVDLTEKELVHDVISKKVSPEAPNYLSDLGVAEFNRYVYGGLDVLQEWFEEPPRSLDYFLRQFILKLDNSMVT